MNRADKIVAALTAAEQAGAVNFWQCQGGMPGRRWTVAGTLVGRAVYGDTAPHMTAERSYSTREVEGILSTAGYLS